MSTSIAKLLNERHGTHAAGNSRTLYLRPPTKKQKQRLAVLGANDAPFEIGIAPILPSRRELKQMVNAGQWNKIGEIFGFTPAFMGKAIDWRCVPENCYKILQGPPGEPFRPENPVNPSSKQSRKSRHLMSKLPRPAVPDRERLYCEQSGQCFYCGQQVIFAHWTVDHKIPLGRGGKGTAENKTGCCDACNMSKGPLTEDEFFKTDYMGGDLSLKNEIRRISETLNRKSNS